MTKSPSLFPEEIRAYRAVCNHLSGQPGYLDRTLVLNRIDEARDCLMHWFDRHPMRETDMMHDPEYREMGRRAHRWHACHWHLCRDMDKPALEYARAAVGTF